MFGGVRKTSDDGTVSRGDIHVFLMGDPGVAKSVTLKFISNIAPRGRYIVGKSASGAGITATVVRDEFLKGWSLEAGAMVLANKGIVCIDADEVAGSVHRHCGGPLGARRVRIHLKFATLRRSGAVVEPALDAVVTAV